MATEIAKQLIYDLRNDDHMREHFSMSDWDGRGTCGTVGCIGGTALVMNGDWIPDENDILWMSDFDPTGNGEKFINTGQQVLGIQFQETAFDLFGPWGWCEAINPKTPSDSNLRRNSLGFNYLPTQERPSMDTVREMVDWARDWSPCTITPDQAANALEQVTVDETPYVNWKRAVEEA